MPGQYSTITLVGPHRTCDLALPGNVPVAQLLPLILRPTVLRAESDHSGPASWMLTTVEGRRLPGNATLQELGLRDGEILHLHDATDAVIVEAVEDVRDTMEDHTDAYGKTWRNGTGRVFATSVAAVVVAATALVGGGQAAVLVTGGLICVLSILVTWWSARDNPMLTHVALVAGALWAWRVGYQATEVIAPHGAAAEPMRHVYGLVLALIITILGLIGTPLGLAYVTALSALSFSGVICAGLLGAGVGIAPIAAGAALVALFALGVLPRATLSAGSLFGLDHEIQAGRDMSVDTLRWRLERIDAMLCGALVAMSAVIGIASVALTLDGDGYAALLGAGAAAALLTRSRIFDQIRHVVPLRAIGALSLGFAGWHWTAASSAVGPWLPAIAVLVCLAYAGATTVDMSTVGRARARRLVGIAELVLVTGLIALTGQVAGLYDLIARMTH